MPSRKSSSTKKKKKKKTTKEQETFTVALKSYDSAMKPLGKRDWKKSKELLEKFIEEYEGKPDVAEIIDRARVHLSTCNQKLAPPPPDPDSAGAWLHQGVALANAVRVDEALESLDQALQLGAPASRVDYARAAAMAIADRNDEALSWLAKAIEADPENKAFSLGDPDFERLREMAGYVSLVEPPERARSVIEEVAAYGQEPLSPLGEGDSLED